MLKYFDHFNTNTIPCPVCQTRTDIKTILIPIDGTKEDGICEAIQVHLDCIDLRYTRDFNSSLFLIYQKITDENIREKSNYTDG